MMSGTSVDGIDIAAVDVDGDDIKVISTGHRDYDEGLRKRILAAASGEAVGAAELAALHVAIGDAYAETVVAFVPTLGAFPAVIAMHGQTVAHLPRRATLQLGDAPLVPLQSLLQRRHGKRDGLLVVLARLVRQRAQRARTSPPVARARRSFRSPTSCSLAIARLSRF